MNRFSFFFAKITDNEEKIASLSASFDALSRDVKGKTVAVVGNARALSEAAQGQLIDSADIVIRLNAAPIPSVLSHGVRTDWIATSIALSPERLEALMPRRILWMTPKRRRLKWYIVRHEGFFLNPRRNQLELCEATRSRPTTGLMVLDLLRRTEAESITIHGFDFFASLSLSGSRTAEKVTHDFAAEHEWLLQLVKVDARFSFISTVNSADASIPPRGCEPLF